MAAYHLLYGKYYLKSLLLKPTLHALLNIYSAANSGKWFLNWPQLARIILCSQVFARLHSSAKMTRFRWPACKDKMSLETKAKFQPNQISHERSKHRDNPWPTKAGLKVRKGGPTRKRWVWGLPLALETSRPGFTENFERFLFAPFLSWRRW